jgi:glycine cleavage system P protein (glycine dehydrogenase) subunit 2
MNDWSRAVSAREANGSAPLPETVTGNHGLQIEEKLIFEQDSPGHCGVDLPEPAPFRSRIGGLEREGAIGLPGLSEPQVVRHFTRLSQKNYAIDTGLYPLGSCTMKHNPRLNEKLVRLPGLADIHPLQPLMTVPGALELIDTLAHWLKTLTGMPAIALSPAAGAHGELCGIMSIRAALEARGDKRIRVLVPESAHGTNPATAAACGYTVDAIPADPTGRVDRAALEAKLGADVAALMLTNPNTCGLFEREIIEIAGAVHRAGAFFYCDGANFNAIVGRVRPADLGIDCMHLNLHKTFSTPHGGGGPGSGPVALTASLAPYAPLPWIVHGPDGLELIEHKTGAAENSLGRLKGFHGQMGMFVRALAYMMSHGSDGLRQVAEDAVLNANYLRARLADDLSLSFPGPCMHEVLFDDRFLKDTGVTTLDFAKALIDEGYHPMTMYFPLIVHGAMLIEPTETESKASLDQFVSVVKALAAAARSGDTARFRAAPVYTPRRRLDETAAARKPVLRWRPGPVEHEGGNKPLSALQGREGIQAGPGLKKSSPRVA